MTMQFDRDRFAEMVGSIFAAEIPGGNKIDLELVEVSELLERPDCRSFSLIFHAPEGLLLDQGLYDVAHETLGPMQLFLVPVGMKENNLMLEALFNLLKEET